MKLAIVRRDGIRADDGRVTRVEGAMHSVFHTNLGHSSGNDERLDALSPEDFGEHRVVEGAVPILVDDVISRPGRELVNDVECRALAGKVGIRPALVAPAGTGRWCAL